MGEKNPADNFLPLPPLEVSQVATMTLFRTKDCSVTTGLASESGPYTGVKGEQLPYMGEKPHIW